MKQYIFMLVLVTAIFGGESCKGRQRENNDKPSFKILFSESAKSGNEYVGTSTYVFFDDFDWKKPTVIRELCDFSSWAICSGKTKGKGKHRIFYFINSISAFRGTLYFHEDIKWKKLRKSVMITLEFTENNASYHFTKFKCRVGCSPSRSEKIFQITCDTIPKLDEKYREISS